MQTYDPFGEHEWKSASKRHWELFVSQGNDGINTRGAARWNVAGGQCDRRENYRNDCEGQRIPSAHAEKQRGKKPRESERGRNAYRDTEENQFRAVREDEAEHIRLLRAKRPADADFARSLRNQVRHHPVEANGCKE